MTETHLEQLQWLLAQIIAKDTELRTKKDEVSALEQKLAKLTKLIADAKKMLRETRALHDTLKEQVEELSMIGQEAQLKAQNADHCEFSPRPNFEETVGYMLLAALKLQTTLTNESANIYLLCPDELIR